MESIAILGATGSIGKSSLDVISRYPDRFTVYAVTANSSVKKLAQAAKDSGAKVAVIADKELLGALQEELRAAGSTAEALAGFEGDRRNRCEPRSRYRYRSHRRSCRNFFYI